MDVDRRRDAQCAGDDAVCVRRCDAGPDISLRYVYR